MLRKVFGPDMDEVIRDRGQQHDEIHEMCSSPNIIRLFTKG
jgi:hypothetical protein